MNLHRAESQAEWQNLAATNRNSWQKLAAKTSGIVTPGNALTLIGLGLSLLGLVALLNENYWVGLAGLAIGRLFDIADGLAANYTGTKSPLGEILDAVADKLITGLALIALGVSGVVGWLMLAGLALPHAIIAVASMLAYVKGRRLHPSRLGKLSMALAWVAIIGFVLAKAAPDLGLISAASVGIALASILLGLAVTLEYLRDYRR